VTWEGKVQWLAGIRLVRRFAGALALDRACRHVKELDDDPGDQNQRRHLVGLVHRASNTRFGREHDFERIRTHADFRRLVPLRTLADFRRQYGQPIGANGLTAAWPALPVAWARSIGADGSTVSIPVSGDLLASHRRAAASALALLLAFRPKAHLLHGPVAILAEPGAAAEPLEAIACARLKPSLRPYWQIVMDDADVERTLARLQRLRARCLVGSSEQLLRILDQARKAALPELAAVVWKRNHDLDASARLRDCMADRGIVLAEAMFPAEAPIAFEDPRHGMLRLFLDHGVFFEFIPLEDLGAPDVRRLGIESVKPHVPYAVAISSAAGVWACLLNERIVFESCRPPLFQILPAETAEMLRRGRPGVQAVPAPHLHVATLTQDGRLPLPLEQPR
jgi:hypothetical protein